MKNLTEIKYKWLLIWALTCVALLFLAEREVVGTTLLYIPIASILAFYLSPIKVITTIYKHKSIKTIVSLCLSYWVMASILGVSVALLVVPNVCFLVTGQEILLFANAILAFYNLFVRDDKDIAFLHVMFMLLQ